MEIQAGVHLVDNVGMPGPGGLTPVNVGLLVEGGKVTMVAAGPPGGCCGEWRAVEAYALFPAA